MKVAYKICPECNGRYDDDGMLCCPKDGSALLSVVEERDPMLDCVLDGRFEIVERIGGGGFSAVYRAIQHPIGRSVAVKVLSASLRSDGRQLTRFAREAKAISKLRSPYTVELYDFGQANDGSPYLVMELLEGRTLHQVIHRDAPLDPVRAARFGAHICESLAEAHHQGITHRDLKPDNVMIQVIADEEIARVLDFGLARIQDADMTVTGTGVVAGTPAYMSPEQALGEKADGRSDLYSLGIILYEAVSGTHPWRRDTATATMHKHVEGGVPDIAKVVEDLPSAFQSLIRELIQPAPARRPRTAKGVRDRLRALAGMTGSVPSIAVSSPVVSERDRAPVARAEPAPATRRTTRVALLAASIVGAVLATGVGQWIGSSEPTESSGRVATESEVPPAPEVVPESAPVFPVEGDALPSTLTADQPSVPPIGAGEAVAVQPEPAVRPGPIPIEGRAPDPSTRSSRREASASARRVMLTVEGPAGAQVSLAGRKLGILPYSGAVLATSQPMIVRVTMPGRHSAELEVVLDVDRIVAVQLPRRAARGRLSDLIQVK